jgi:hypothetical protein
MSAAWQVPQLTSNRVLQQLLMDSACGRWCKPLLWDGILQESRAHWTAESNFFRYCEDGLKGHFSGLGTGAPQKDLFVLTICLGLMSYHI